MDAKEILGFCLKNGVLVDKDVLNLFSGTTDTEDVKLIIESIKTQTNKRIITKSVFEDKENVEKVFSNIPQDKLRKLKIKLGLSIEISSQKSEILDNSPNLSQIKEINKPEIPVYEISSESVKESNLKMRIENDQNPVKIVSMVPTIGKKLEVRDFVKYFRNRFTEMRNFLQERPELTNLLSINKISGNKQGISLIGIVSDKKVTKNQNILMEVEDLTGKIKILVTKSKKEVYEKAEDIALDSTIGFKVSGNREILFANDIVFPEAMIHERKNSHYDESALFISDIHIGSKLFLEDSFLKFIDYLNCRVPKTPEAEKIKYLFVVGDIVAGIGVYPNQERELEINDIEGQYSKAAELFAKIRKDIKIIMLPGNHDCVRLMEPQPILDEKYAWPLYNLKNITLTANPSMINIGSKENFSGFDVLAYHGFSFFYYANSIPKLIKQNSVSAPDKIMHYLLQNRHLAPSHGSVQHYPAEKDPLLIRKIPDIFVSGHTHVSGVSYYNNILVISSTCWEDLTTHQEKYGVKPDFCKVPMFNLKSRQVKILDFEDDEHKKRMGEVMSK